MNTLLPPFEKERALFEALPPQLHQAKCVLVGVSGGSDSVALLCLLVRMMPLEVHVAHVNHGMRVAASADAAFVKGLCEQLAVPYYETQCDVPRIAKQQRRNLEETARQLRYTFLTRTAKQLGAAYVLTGHTLNDQAETVLMQLLRGSSFLRGMVGVRGQLLRPLLGVTRAQLIAYLQALGQPYCHDITNDDTSYTRAWLRAEIVPRLLERYPRFLEVSGRLSGLQQAHEAHFDKLSQHLIQKGQIEVAKVLKADIAVQRHVLAQLLKGAHLPSDVEHIERLRQGLVLTGGKRISVPKGYEAEVAYGKLELIPPTPIHPVSHPLAYKHMTAFEPAADPHKLAAFTPLTLRTRQPGDRISLRGGTKKVSDLLNSHKISRTKRDKLLMLANDKQVLWIQDPATPLANTPFQEVIQAVRGQAPLAVDRRVATLKDQVRTDEDFMRAALVEAEAAFLGRELPIGAVVVYEGEIIAKAHNQTEKHQDPSAHAELLALKQAAKVLGSWRLSACTLYVTLEPCPMCFGAMLQAHVPMLVYGAPNVREGALGGVADLQEHPWKRQIDVKAGVLAGSASTLLKRFFKLRRVEGVQK